MTIAAVVGGLHGLVFAWIEPVLPNGILRRGLAYGAILWTLMAVYFELHAFFNMFGEPPVLVAVELVLWIAVLAVEGIILSALYGRVACRSRNHRTARPPLSPKEMGLPTRPRIRSRDDSCDRARAREQFVAVPPNYDRCDGD